MLFELKDLCIGYNGHSVAGPICADLRQGELCCLLGPNGAGKSTMLRTLAAFQPPLSGSLLLKGRDVRTIPTIDLSTTIGVVLTDRIDIKGIKVKDLVGMGRAPYTNFWGKLSEEDEECVDKAISDVGIQSLAQRLVSTLSDGERQKVMIAKALAQETPIILLDEPTAFLDYPSKVETMLLLRKLCREMNKCILLSTHDLDLALQTADRLWLMSQTHGFATGSPHALSTEGKLSQFFSSKHISFDTNTMRFEII